MDKYAPGATHPAEKALRLGADGNELRLLAKDLEARRKELADVPMLSLHRAIWALAERSLKEVARWLDGRPARSE